MVSQVQYIVEEVSGRDPLFPPLFELVANLLQTLINSAMNMGLINMPIPL
jgi:hypothetical protein